MTEVAANLLTNEYSGEHKARRAVREAAEEIGFVIESYGLTDKAATRTLAIKLKPSTGDAARPDVVVAVEKALEKHGYTFKGDLVISVKATKDVTNQTVLNFNTGAGDHPDNVPQT